MQLPVNVENFFDNFDNKKNYGYFIFIAGNPLSSAELNEFQDTFINQQNLLKNILLENGTIISGGSISVKNKTISINECNVYTNRDLGFISYLPFTSINVNNFPARVGLYVQKLVYTGADDNALYEPYPKSPNYGEDSSYRLKYYTSFVSKEWYDTINDGSIFIPLADVNQNGSVIYLANEGDLNQDSFLKRLNGIDKRFDDLKKQIDEEIQNAIKDIDISKYYLKAGDTLEGDMNVNKKKLYSDNTYFAPYGTGWKFGRVNNLQTNDLTTLLDISTANNTITVSDDATFRLPTMQVNNISSYNGTSVVLDSNVESNKDILIKYDNRPFSTTQNYTNALTFSLAPLRPNLFCKSWYEESVGNYTQLIMQVESAYYKFTSSGNLIGNVFQGVAMEANFADLAEYYTGDKKYPIGTVMCIGGINEVTQTSHKKNISIGVISEKPGYVLNSGEKDKPLANLIGLVGRVNVRIIGKVNRGDLITVSETQGIGEVLPIDDEGRYFAIALESHSDTCEKLVLCKLQHGRN